MATNNRGRGAGRNRDRGGRNNNPDGRNQYSGITSRAREHPLATAAAVGGAIAAGVFLWSRRNEISDQIGSLADQINEWRDGVAYDSDMTVEDAGARKTFMGGSRSGDRRTQAEIAEEALTLKVTGEAD